MPSSPSETAHPLNDGREPRRSASRTFGNPLAQSPTIATAVPSTAAISFTQLPPQATASHAHETATSKLQFQTVQSALQGCGIRSESAGWLLVLAFVNGYMVEPRSAKGKEKERTEYDRWERLARMLGQAQITASAFDVVLLLPRDALGYYQHIGSAFLAAHLLIVATHATNGVRQAVTLSGLRGFINANDELVFTSCTLGFPFADAQHNMTDPEFQESLIGPTLLSNGQDLDAYPRHKLQRLSSLTIPQHPSLKGDKAFETPPLPARKSSSSATSRIASLFGGSGASLDRPSLRSPRNSLSTLDEAMTVHSGSLSVNAACVDKVLKWSDNIRAIKKGDEARLRSMLEGRLAPLRGHVYWADAVDKAVAFLKVFEPPPPSAINSNDWRLSVKEKDKHKTLGNLYVLANEPEGAEKLSAAMQDLYDAVQHALIPVTSEGDEQEKSNDFEQIAEAVLEIVEATITDLLYDRLFNIASSSDAADDEALASKNAGLNLLELSLEHLGLDIGDPSSATHDDDRDTRDVLAIRFGLEALVRECEGELRKLESPDQRTPKAKLGVLIQTHKIIVDRLSSLPPIPMKKDGQEKKAAAASLAVKPRGTEYEMVDSNTTSPISKSPPTGLPAISLQRETFVDENVFNVTESRTPTQSTRSASPNPALSSSADLILPLLIYCVVRSNPLQLASNLAFIHRFRAESLLNGEASYCLVNMQAVVDFVLNIDKHMAALGLDNDRVNGHAPSGPLSFNESASFPSSVRNKVSQEIENLAGHVTDGITGVAGVVSFLITRTAELTPGPRTIEDVRNVLSGENKNAGSRESISSGLFRRANVSFRNRSQSHVEPLYARPEREEGEVASNPILPIPIAESTVKPSLSNRLASLARFGGTSPSAGSQAYLKTPNEIPSHARTLSAGSFGDASRPDEVNFTEPPIDAFLSGSVGDLKVGDLQLLLDDYRRLAAFWQQQQRRAMS